MATHLLKRITSNPSFPPISTRHKTTSSQYVSSRIRDATFEKHMDKYKNLLKVISIQDLILANPNNPSVSVDFLNRLSQKLHLNRGATSFLRKYPRIFEIFYHPTYHQPYCQLTPLALQIFQQEQQTIKSNLPLVIDRLTRLLSMSLTKTLPLRAIFKIWRELGLPDDFEDTIIIPQSASLFQILDAHEPNTHLIKLNNSHNKKFTASVEDWRVMECCKENSSVDRTEIRFSFKQSYPPSMKLKKNFRAKVKEWQKLPYIGPYEEMNVTNVKKRSKRGVMEMEKRAVGIVHEFLSLTVEKMVEVEKISHFRKWFGIELNVRDLFLDHPGMFYLSTKGKRHTVFLREAYERGGLVEPNDVYCVRRKLLDLVVLGRRGLKSGDYNLSESESESESDSKDDLKETQNE